MFQKSLIVEQLALAALQMFIAIDAKENTNPSVAENQTQQVADQANSTVVRIQPDIQTVQKDSADNTDDPASNESGLDERPTKNKRESNLQIKKAQLRDLAKAIEYDAKNMDALRLLTTLGFDKEVGEQALKIYDPHKATQTPWAVDLELGQHELEQKNPKKAVEYLRKARKKNPRSPEATIMLVRALLGTGENLDEALSLADQLSMKPSPGVAREESIASFFDTRGMVLMKMERFAEAAAAFEIAFRSSQDDTSIIKRLIECYEKIGNDRLAQAYQRRLDKLKQELSDQQSVVPENDK